MAEKKRIRYVTSSKFKRQENEAFRRVCTLADGRSVDDVFEFQFASTSMPEPLEVNLKTLVLAEVAVAYQRVEVPCIVEHAGLIFQDYESHSYPGGLTKPMWNALGDKFLAETNSPGRRAIAQAVVAYCDGAAVRSYVGETRGVLAGSPRGQRAFYWDTVFIPDNDDGTSCGMTYAEMVADKDYGLDHKMKHYSQSSRAMLKFLEDFLTMDRGLLFPDW